MNKRKLRFFLLVYYVGPPALVGVSYGVEPGIISDPPSPLSSCHGAGKFGTSCCAFSSKSVALPCFPAVFWRAYCVIRGAAAPCVRKVEIAVSAYKITAQWDFSFGGYFVSPCDRFKQRRILCCAARVFYNSIYCSRFAQIFISLALILNGCSGNASLCKSLFIEAGNAYQNLIPI